jgi:hypothetical protein
MEKLIDLACVHPEYRTNKQRKLIRGTGLQVSMMYYLMNRWNKSIDEFLEMDKRFNILWLLRIGYERFHLTGDEGIAIEIEEHIQEVSKSKIRIYAKITPKTTRHRPYGNKMSKEELEFAGETALVLVIEQVAFQRNITPEAALHWFSKTKTFDLLHEDKSSLRYESIPYILDMLNSELTGDWDNWGEL